ncbi:DUF895 domain membrane protein [Tyrophagus putrescentiae]|nr:DUF895 domain membrane protein [Tyrophagus putrescentiae]
MIDRNLLNVLVLGLSFMLLFTSFQTGGMIQGTVVQSIKAHDSSYNADGFISMCIIYAVLAICNWFAPAFVNFLGPRVSMIISGFTYIIFIANFLYPLTWLLYVVSVVVGVGAAIIWTAQGNYLTLCSNDRTMSRNSGLFWALLQCSFLWGNIFVFTYFTTDADGTIKDSTIKVTYTVLSVLGLIGVGSFFLLGKPQTDGIDADDSRDSENIMSFVSRSLKESFGLLFTRQMFLLMVTSCYTGIELAFFSVVYGTAIGNTNNLVDSGESPKKYIGLSGMLIGVGEILGGLSFGILGSKTNRLGRDPIVILGYFTHMVAFFLVFINFPKNASLQQSNEAAYIASSLAIALVCSFLFGFADSCYNTQMYSIIGTVYADNSANAFALFKFFQSIACACALFYSAAADLYVQLCILAVTASIGTVTFVLVEWQTKRDAATGIRRTD